ncbi:hypothetical protein D3C72_2596250 [compost metagenome]
MLLQLLGGAVQAGGAPEALLELAVAAFLAGELDALGQGQAPGDDGEADEQPDDQMLDGGEGVG